MDAEKIKKINKLAKTLKDSGLAPSMDEAAKMAENMIAKGEEEQIAKEEEFLEEEAEEKKEPFIIKKPEKEKEEEQTEIKEKRE